MRIFLLPITRSHTLLYAQRLNQILTTKQSRLEKITTKAAERWVAWEGYEKGWQKKVTVYGNQLFARIPYQEWGLKSVPPLAARRADGDAEIKGDGSVEVLFPGGILGRESAEGVLRRLATERQAFHRSRMIWTVVGMPFTIPFALVPVIPNLPFFYMAFRAWSHWKALAGSNHITFLLDKKLLKYQQSSILQKIYDIKELPQESVKLLRDSLADTSDIEEKTKAFTKAIEAEPVKPATSTEVSTQPDELVASIGTGHLISLCFGLPQVDTELERAIKQVQKQMVAESAEKASTTTSGQPVEKDKQQ